MKVLFCNIAWMKYYEGVTAEDKPKNGGKYIKENEDGSECTNFVYDNGKCYGSVMTYGNFAFEEHYEDVSKHAPYISNVLVVWVATHKTNETRIVGWYKNATVFRSEQIREIYTVLNANSYYNIVADAKDCYLLPEENRNFEIQRAAKAGVGKGMGRSNFWYPESAYAQINVIPKVVEYIDGYKGAIINKKYTKEMLQEGYPEYHSEKDFDKLLDMGLNSYDSGDFFVALKYFNTAMQIKENPDVIFNIADALNGLNCIDEAISEYQKVIEMEGESIDTLARLIGCYDYIQDKEKTLDCCRRSLPLLGDTAEDIGTKTYLLLVMFNIYLFSLGDKESAKLVVEQISALPDSDERNELIVDLKSNLDKDNPEWV